jgi:hypothetical protein
MPPIGENKKQKRELRGLSEVHSYNNKKLYNRDICVSSIGDTVVLQ